MSLSIKKETGNLFSVLGAKKSLSEHKKDLFEGEFLGLLRSALPDSGDLLIAVDYVREHHSLDEKYSILKLSLGFKPRDPDRPVYEKDLVIQYGCDHLGEGVAVRYWSYPDDPALPDLPDFLSSPDFLRTIQWDCPFEQFIPVDEEICIQKLLYNVNRRITYLLSSGTTGKRFILKMVRQKDFESFFKKADALRKSSLMASLILPKLVSFSKEKSLFLYDYISGLEVKKMKGNGQVEIKARLRAKVVQILKTIHQTTLPGLPLWDPEHNEVNRLESVWAALKHHPGTRQREAAERVRPLLNRLIARFKQEKQAYSFMIHNSFSEKHLLFQAASGQFGVLDWDSAVIGPRERDIGQFLSSHTKNPDDCSHFINLYQSETGHSVDQNFVHAFIVYQDLLKLMGKGLRRYDLTEHDFDEFKTLASQLDVSRGK